MARILVVDDSEDVRLALITLLEDVGHDVLEAEDGSEVIAMVLSGSPELVLLDVAMPRVDGFEALKRLKADAATSDVPVIMVTAKGRPEDLAMARNLGARDYINKPWAEGEVEMRVDWALSANTRV
ncbi:MAG: response regulator [Chloroflexi bacterium]|nr:response regulator [Chloroflexota bacterium]MCH8817140.1 response regulator [Chloroflexota bacterium]